MRLCVSNKNTEISFHATVMLEYTIYALISMLLRKISIRSKTTLKADTFNTILLY